MSDHLFTLPSDAYAVTSDDCYTPRWVFDAMGLEFDLDVAAPPGGPWHVPARYYFAPEDDGLSQEWQGLVWCNPPFSTIGQWVDRFVQHDTAVFMGFVLRRCHWFRKLTEASDAVAFTTVVYSRPDGSSLEPRMQSFVAFHGVGTEPAERLAAADPYGAVLYGRSAA